MTLTAIVTRRRELQKVPAYKCQLVGDARTEDAFAAADEFNRRWVG